MMKSLFVVTLIVFLFTLNSIQAKENTISPDFQIVVSVPYLKDILSNITCHQYDDQIKSLIPVGVDPHTFILSPKDRALINDKSYVVEIGAGLEPWLDRISFQKDRHVILSDHLSYSVLADGKKIETQNHLNLDPHIWQSPRLTKQAVAILANKVSGWQPKWKNSIERCSQNYLNLIQTTEDDLKKQVISIPVQKRILVTNHDSLGYFSETYGFRIATILGLSDDEEPTMGQLNDLINMVKKEKIQAVFLETTGNIKNIETIAKNSQIKIGGKLYGDSLGEKGGGADTTIEMWKSNMKTIIQGLKN